VQHTLIALVGSTRELREPQDGREHKALRIADLRIARKGTGDSLLQLSFPEISLDTGGPLT